MPTDERFASSPLAATVRLLDSLNPDINAVHLGLGNREGWVTCQELVDEPAEVRRWGDGLATHLAELYPDATAAAVRLTAAACVLDSYAYAPGFLVGAMVHVAQRVPHVAPELVAVRRHPTEHWISGVAVLDDRFWCLPGDPDADHPAATVVTSPEALADEARREVLDHATGFLATYDPGVGLGRRARVWFFLDSLDSAPWIAAEHLPPLDSCLATSALLLPGLPSGVTHRSRLYPLTDARGRTHVTRRRLSCCRSHLVDDACMDCPRTNDARRLELAAELPDSAATVVGDET